MLATYFKRQTTQATYYSGPAGPYLDAFTNWLEERGYATYGRTPVIPALDDVEFLPQISV